jgi:carboxyl-terminal processing protease
MGRNSRRSFLALAGGGLLASGCLSRLQGDHLKVFDAVWSIVDQQYFDPAMGGLDWRSLRREWRPRAERAESQAALYLNVLSPMLDLFPASHVELRPPQVLDLSGGRRFRAPRQKQGLPVFLTLADEAGMGARLTWTGAAFAVETVDRDGPAYRAGLRPGQNVRIAGMSLPAANARMELIDTPSNRVFEVVWTPGRARARTERRELGHGVGYLRFNVFDATSVAWALETLKGAGTSRLILDLRENTGGLIAEVARLSSALLPAGSDLGVFRSRERDYPVKTAAVSTAYAGSLAVLIGPRSMSGAEISAACLRHHGRARLFGMPTAGAVLASQTYDLPDDGRLTVPYADYRTPAGGRIEGVGVDPDVRVAHTPQSAVEGSDPALTAARRWLTST